MFQSPYGVRGRSDPVVLFREERILKGFQSPYGVRGRSDAPTTARNEGAALFQSPYGVRGRSDRCSYLSTYLRCFQLFMNDKSTIFR